MIHKFRGIALESYRNESEFLIKKGDFIYGSLICKGNRTFIDGDDCFISGGVEVDKETVGQYIGLMDIDKVEIYDDDIISVNSFYSGFTFNHLVEYDEKTTCYPIKVEGDKFGYFDVSSVGVAVEHCDYIYKIIGNKHQHPELLTGSK